MRSLAVAVLVAVGLTGAACSEEAAVSIATDVAEDLGADEACVATVASMVRASIQVSDELVDGRDEDVASVLDALERFVAAAPPEVRADAATLFDAWAGLATAHDAGDEAAEAEARRLLDGPEVDGAEAAITAWFDAHCSREAATTTTTLR